MMKTWKYIAGPLKDMTPISKILWLYIAQHGVKDYGTLEVAEQLGISTVSINAALKQLESGNVIEVLERGQKSSPRVVRAIME
jgi:DNA-binding transcriptional regulator LsrR (DeoR family)